MMKQMAKGGAVPGVPGIPAMPGMRAPKQKKQQKGKGAKKVGNPAKRAAIEAGLDVEESVAPATTLTELPDAFKGFLS
jgi:signal recognition particle subunit SRP54